MGIDWPFLQVYLLVEGIQYLRNARSSNSSKVVDPKGIPTVYLCSAKLLECQVTCKYNSQYVVDPRVILYK